jgi:putative oligomerization/nucleic acid binding protein
MLLSSAMRNSALTQSTVPVHAWFAGRQYGGWAGQWGAHMVAEDAARKASAQRAAQSRPATDPATAEAMRTLAELHATGVVTDEEFERLRARVGP